MSYPLGLAFLGIIVGLAGCQWPWQGPAPKTASIHLSGTVEAREVNLAFQVRGRLQTLHIDEGEKVAAGGAVADLDDRDYQLALAQAEAQRRVAAAVLAALEAGSRPQELVAARATRDRAEADLNYTRTEVKRLEGLVAKHLASPEQQDQALRARGVATGALEEATARLRLVEEGPRREDIERARADLQARQVAVDQARLQLNYTHLMSPAAGVVSARLAEAGEMVEGGRPVLRLSRADQPWVRAYLGETHLSRVKLGQSVAITVDGLPGQTFKGRLNFISPVAEFTPKTVETRELRVDLVYRVKVDVTDPQGQLRNGMPADVVVETDNPP